MQSGAGDGLFVPIEIGNQTFRGRLPLLPHRYALWHAFDQVTDRAIRRTPIDLADLAAALEVDEVPTGAELEALVAKAEGLKLEDGVVYRVAVDRDLIDADDVSALAVAAIGLCWDDDVLVVEASVVDVAKRRSSRERFILPGQAPHLLRAVGRDLVVFGEHVAGALVEHGITDARATMRCGSRLRTLITGSIPRAAEVQDAAGNSEARGATSTGSSSSRG